MRARGFTLIELVVVIIILGIVGTMTSRFLSQSVELYSNSALQQQRIAESRFVLDRLNREVSGIHPFSLRDPFASDLTYQGKCIEYIRISAVSSYLDTAAGKSSLTLIDAPTDQLLTTSTSAIAAQRRLSVHAQSATNLYSSADSTTVKAIQAFNSSTRVASFSSAFDADSTGHRYVVLDQSGPTAWCLFNNKLYRYSGYNPNYAMTYSGSWFATQAAAGAATLMAENLLSQTTFNVVSPSLVHNAALNLSLVFAMDTDSHGFAFNRQMQVSYVP